MGFRCIPLKDAVHSCGYFRERTAVTEHFLLKDYTPGDLDALLATGYRHFGRYFFRPRCGSCTRCIPIRVDAGNYRFSRNAKRILTRAGRFQIIESGPAPSREAYDLYLRHLLRFGEREESDWERFKEAFFADLPGSRQLSVFDEDRLIAVSHFDRGQESLSAVYTYYDEAYARNSLGSLGIFKLIELARASDARYLYLGYYIEDNRHMVYKQRYRPNEVLLSGDSWVPFCGGSGPAVPDAESPGFVPGERFFEALASGKFQHRLPIQPIP